MFPIKRLATFAIAAAGLTVMLGLAAPSPGHSASSLLPNLQPKAASEVRIAYESDGSKLLRFTTLGWNSGSGPLEIVPGAVDTGTQKQQVYQRIYDDAGGSSDHLAGFMEWHASHGHFHFNGYAHYTLRPATANGTPERYGDKVTFCLMDTNRIDHRLDGAPKRAVYSSCGLSRQGISVGWGDAYRYYLDGQSIDITGLPDGDYDLVITLDPQGRIIETNDGDNVSVTRLTISGDSVTVAGGGPGNGRGR